MRSRRRETGGARDRAGMIARRGGDLLAWVRWATRRQVCSLEDANTQRSAAANGETKTVLECRCNVSQIVEMAIAAVHRVCCVWVCDAEMEGSESSRAVGDWELGGSCQT